MPISRRLQSFLKVYIGISSCDWVVSTLLSNVRYRNILLMCSMCSTVCFCCHVSRKNAANMFRSSFPFFFYPPTIPAVTADLSPLTLYPPPSHTYMQIYTFTLISKQHAFTEQKYTAMCSISEFDILVELGRCCISKYA